MPRYALGRVDLGRDRAAVVEVGEAIGEVLEGRSGRGVRHALDLEAERVDRHGLLDAAGVHREDRRRRVRDHHVLVARARDAETAVAEGEREELPGSVPRSAWPCGREGRA